MAQDSRLVWSSRDEDYDDVLEDQTWEMENPDENVVYETFQLKVYRGHSFDVPPWVTALNLSEYLPV